MSVTDSGIGMTEANNETSLASFGQVDNSPWPAVDGENGAASRTGAESYSDQFVTRSLASGIR